jgi:hypothetical protein
MSWASRKRLKIWLKATRAREVRPTRGNRRVYFEKRSSKTSQPRAPSPYQRQRRYDIRSDLASSDTRRARRARTSTSSRKEA